VVLLGLVSLAGSLRAEDVVFLRGFEVTPNHVVFGSIDSLRGSTAIINLGFGHGMKPGTALVVTRNVLDELIPISGLTVLSTEADHSRCRIEGPFRVQAGDFVLVHASHLDLWGGELRLDRLAKERLLRRTTGNGYNTLDASPDLIDEVAHDDSFQQRQHISFERSGFLSEAARKVGPLKSRLGAITPLPTIDPSRPEVRDEAIRDSDITVLSLRLFLEAASDHDALMARLETSRLERLRQRLDGSMISETDAPLTRTVLETWTRRALSRS
jgi:hypothetical protein